MSGLFSREALALRGREALWLLASLLASLALVVYTKSTSGDLLSEFTDHLHHARITWTFLNAGLDTYRLPFSETAAAHPYPHVGVTWERFPLAYPPGMLVVFLPTALLGRYVPMATQTFGKLNVAYLLVVTHVALWVLGATVRRVSSRTFTALFVMLWVVFVRLALLGFYDGAWLLCGALAAHAMTKRDDARAVIWFVAALLISYRALALAPLGLVALAGLLRGSLRARRKLTVTCVAGTGAAITIATFWMLVHYGPKDAESFKGVTSSLLPMSFRPYALLSFGLAVAGILALSTDIVVGLSVALCTALAILHGGHTWHGCLLVVPFIAFALARKRPLYAQILLAVWIPLTLQVAFEYAPFRFAEELIRFFEYDGHYTPPRYCI